jgi:hypothetical protein
MKNLPTKQAQTLLLQFLSEASYDLQPEIRQINMSTEICKNLTDQIKDVHEHIEEAQSALIQMAGKL